MLSMKLGGRRSTIILTLSEIARKRPNTNLLMSCLRKLADREFGEAGSARK